MTDAAKNHRNAVLAIGGKILDLVMEKGVRQRQQKTRAIAGFLIPPGSAAMHKAFENGYPVLYNLMRSAVVYVGNNANAASIVFVFERVQPLILYRGLLF
jgi:hypothetical protein